MKLTNADIIPSRLKFNSHTTHNPECDILQLTISRDAFITYYINRQTGAEGLEYYAGANYVPNSTAKSISFHYPSANIPKKYRTVWNGLKGYYKTHYAAQ